MGIFFIIAFVITLLCILWLIAPLLKKQKTSANTPKSKWRFIASLCMTVVLAIGGWLVYFSTGDVTIIDKLAKQEQQQNASPDINELMDKLNNHLANNQDDLEGWLIKARMDMSQGNFNDSLKAIETAYNLSKSEKYINAISNADRSEIIGRYVDSAVVVDKGKFNKKTHALLDEAIALDSENPQALWLIAMSYSQRGDHQTSLDYFAKARILVADSGQQQEIDQLDRLIIQQQQALLQADVATNNNDVNDAQVQANLDVLSQILEPASLVSSANAADNVEGSIKANLKANAETISTASTAVIDASGAEPELLASNAVVDLDNVSEVEVVVELSPELLANASPDDTIFIIARATTGPKAPLAVIKSSVADLPLTDVIDDGKRMLPFTTIARMVSNKQMLLIARLSKSGKALKQEGDIQVEVVVHEWLEQGKGLPIRMVISE